MSSIIRLVVVAFGRLLFQRQRIDERMVVLARLLFVQVGYRRLGVHEAREDRMHQLGVVRFGVGEQADDAADGDANQRAEHAVVHVGHVHE